MSRSTISLFNTNFVGLSNKKAELIQHLNNLHKSLKSLTQDEALGLQKVLKTSTAPQLLSHKILSHNDKDVKLLSCCCIVDVLRLMAPENPYNNEDTITAFNAVVNQLRGIATYAPVSDILGSHVYYILNNIATVQSCVVPVMLAMDGVYGADEVAEALFSTILSSVRADHPPEVLARSLEVLQACIVESEGKNEELLEQLLLPLLPHNKTDNIAAYQVAATVLRDAWSTLEGPVSSILNQILVGTSRESVGSSAEIADHVYSLIFELHRMAPALLNAVIPSICLQLQVEEEDVRLRAAMLLGQLFASSHAEYGVEFTRSFKEYLGRSNDISANIRLEVVNSFGFIVQNKPALRKHIEEPLVQRLRDPDERLRQAALTRLIDFASAAPGSLLLETYTEMAEKVKDKRPEVRRLATVGLARIYNRHVSQHLPALTSVTAEGSGAAATYLRESIDSDVLERLQIIPGVLLQCWGYPEMSTRHLVIHLLQEVLLPKVSSDSSEADVDETTTASSPTGTNTTTSKHKKKTSKSSSDSANDIDDRRASALLLIFEGLSISERNALAAVLNFKAKARVELQAFLKIRSAPVRTSRNSDAISRSSSHSSHSNGNNSEMTAEEHMKSLRKCMLKLIQTIPAVDKKASYFENIYANKDRTVFRLLESCVSPSDSIVQSLQNREDLKQRLVSKSALGEYMGMVFDVTSHMAANAGLVRSLLTYLEGVSISPDASACSDLLVLIAKYSAQAFQSSADAVATWLSTCLNFDAGRGAKRELKAQLLSQCLTMINSVCASFEAKEAQHGLCTELIEHIKRVDHPETCDKLAELVGQIAYYSNYDPSSPADPCSVRAMRTLITQLCSSKCLSQRNKRLDADLAVLGALCQVPKAAYVALNFTKPSFAAVAEVICAKIPTLVAFVKESVLRGNTSEAEQPRPAATTAALALRAMTSALCTQEELRQIRRHKTTSSSASESSAANDGGLKDLKTLVVMLFDCIKTSGGQLGGFVTEEETEKEVLFEAAADCALSMMKLHVFARSLTVDQWHTLGWTLLCPVPSIRQKLFNTLSLSIQTHPLHSKFLAYPCLFANDETLYPRAEQALGFAVQRRRRTHEELCSQALGQTGNQTQLQRLTEDLMPESILPYLLHLLSYHPDFPTSTAIETETDKRHMKNLVRSVSMLLQVLQNSLVNESCNMSYLLKLLNTANRYFVDKHDPDNVGLHFVTRMTVKMLHEQVKTSDNLQIHPGDVSLPAELYQRKMAMEDHTAAESSVAVVMLGAGTEEGFDEAELAIDRALHIAGKSNKPQRGGASRTAIVAQSKAGGDHVSRKRAAESPAEDRRHSRTSVGSTEKVAPVAVSRLPEEAPTRSLPKRGAKEAVVNYREPVESDREMLQWEAAAAHSKRPRRSSELSLEPRTSLSAPLRTSAGGDRGSSGGLSGWIAGATKPATDKADTTKPASSSQRARMSSPTARNSVPPSEKSPLGRTQDSFDLLTEEIPVVDTVAASSSSKDHNKKHEETPAAHEGAVSSSSSSKARALKSKTNILPEAEETVPATKKAKQHTAAPTVPTTTAAAVPETATVGRKSNRATTAASTTAKPTKVSKEDADTVPAVRRSTRALRV